MSKWYIAGSVLAAGHLAVVPLLAGPVGRIIAAAEKDDVEGNRREMQSW